VVCIIFQNKLREKYRGQTVRYFRDSSVNQKVYKIYRSGSYSYKKKKKTVIRSTLCLTQTKRVHELVLIIAEAHDRTE
jgi:hypothetical protein